MPRKLYHPEKYKVLLGSGSDGLCTTWSDPESLVRKHPGLLKRFAIIGTLYSREGVSIIIRNLALNPDIRKIYLLNDIPLARTEYGMRGWKLLMDVWNGKNEGIHKEIELDVLDKIRSNVEIVEISHNDLEGLEKEDPEKRDPYMEPVEFKEKEVSAEDALPSEGIGFIARGKKLWQAWLRAIDRVMRYGRIKGTEYGSRQKELSSLLWVVEEKIEDLEIPSWPEPVLRKVGFIGYEKYLDTYLNPEKPDDVAYTYGQRLRDFKGIDQVSKIIEKLKKAKITRRAVACLFNPEEDFSTHSPPCLDFIQFLERDGKLDMTAVFRSHDMFKAAVPNLIGLMNLHKFVSENAGIERGKIAVLSVSAHIYEEDWDDALELLKCQIWERKKAVFTEEDMDPRGNVVIRVEGKEIVLEINGIEVRGRSAREVAYTLANLDLLSSPQHWAYVGMELQKAEISIALGLEYKQDHPVKL